MTDKMATISIPGVFLKDGTSAHQALSTLEFETLVIKVGIAFCLGKIFTINFSKTEQHEKIFAALEKMYNENSICVGLLNDDRLNFSPSNIGLYAMMVGLDRDRRCCSFIGRSRFEVLDISELVFESNQYANAKIRLLEDRKIGDKEQKEFNYLRNTIDKIMATLFGWGDDSALQQGHWNNHIFDKNMEPGKLADQIISSSEMFSECRNQVFYQLDPCVRLRITVYRLESIVQRMIEEAKNSIAKAKEAESWNRLLGATNQADKKLAERFNKVKSFMYPEMAKVVEDRLASCNGMGATSKAHKENVEFILSMPWGKYALETHDSLNVISAQLDKDHYGMPDAKKKILQYLAIKQLNPQGQNSVLCLIGPPGTGKTSFFQSLGRALDRPFVKFALGGVHDESDIRGHSMTYVGALAGRIIQLVRQSGVMNPVFVLDEIDKLGEFSAQGNPAAALLEVLDPEQNSKFIDNYIGGPIDLSQVIFVITGNDIQGINPILRDRLHIIKIEGYTPLEKFMIAKNYLIPRQLENTGVWDFVEFSDEAIQKIVDGYIYEEGVRGIDHCIYDICAERALLIVSGGLFSQTKIGISEVEKIMVNHKATGRDGREIGYGAK